MAKTKIDSKSKKINNIIQMLASHNISNNMRKKFLSITKFVVTNKNRYMKSLVFINSTCCSFMESGYMSSLLLFQFQKIIYLLEMFISSPIFVRKF